MTWLQQHLTKCLIAGIVALLPIGGLVLTVAYLEHTISSSGISKLKFYFPGMGILLALILIYLIGLTVSTFIGKWVWRKVDTILNRVPALGKFYLSLKEILGYGENEDAMFQETVLVQSPQRAGQEIGLVTKSLKLPDGKLNHIVFIPGSPNPTAGRLIVCQDDEITPIEASTNDTLKMLVALGKSDFEIKTKKA